MIIPIIILKNLKIIFRSPFTILLLILSPILLMLIVGFTYSGTTLTDTSVGLIETEKSMFTIRGVNFKEYNTGDFYESRNKCVLDLKKGEVDLCVRFKTTYDNNKNLVNAKISYFVDDTRPQITDILVRNFNNLLDVKTKEISTKTIEDIFEEVKETVKFMRESEDLIVQIEGDLNLTEDKLEEARESLILINDEYTQSYPEIVENIEDLRTSIKDNENSLDNLRDDFIDLQDELNSLNSDLPNYIDNLEDSIEGIESFAMINPSIYSYVDVDELSSMKSDLESLNSVISKSRSTVSTAINNLNNIPDSSQVIQGLDDMADYSLDMKNYLSFSITQSDELLANIDERQSEIKDIKVALNDKLNYFDELSNKKASSITEPITKEYHNIFDNFSRVHQLAPTVVILVLLFIGLLLSNVIVSLEINSKAYFRNLISPISQFKFMLSLFFTSFIIISIQILFLFIILDSFFGIKLIDSSLTLAVNVQNLSQIFVVVLHLLLVFILLGILLAYLFSSIQISILVTTFVMLFLFLLSNIIVPLNIMPTFFANILKFSPVVLGENLLRLLFFYSKYYSLRFIDLVIFYPIALILTILVFFANNLRKKKLF